MKCTSKLLKTFAVTIMSFFLLVALHGTASGQNTITVCSSGCDFTTIQAAVNSANAGDIVLVHSGIYYEHVVLKANITLQGQDRSTTIIDGGGAGNVILMAPGTTVSNLTIRNGAVAAMSDGADYWTLTNCDLKDNSEDGVRLANGSLDNHIFNCSISGNDLGIHFLPGNGAVIEDVEIFNNRRGVFFDFGQGNIAFTRCRVFKNKEAGFWTSDFRYGQITIDHCVIAENEQVGLIGGGGDHADQVIVQNSIIFDNGTIGLYTFYDAGMISRYNDVFSNNGGDYGSVHSPGVLDRTGDISANPLFVNPYNDFRVACGSPVIGAASDGSNMGPYQGCENVVRPRTLFVSTSGSDISGDGSSGNPFRTVQKGVDEAFPFDTVQLLPGVYNENVVLQQKKNLIGSGIGETTIDGGGTGNVVKMARGTTVSGLTIRNGVTGVMSDGADYWLLANCEIRSNSENGVRLATESLENHISACSISENNLGIYFVGAGYREQGNAVVIDDVDIFNNQRGVYTESGNRIAFTRCRVFKNREAGFWTSDFRGGQITIDHCVIAENEQVGLFGGGGNQADQVIVQNSIIFDNGTIGLYTFYDAGLISRYNDVFSNNLGDYVSEHSTGILDKTGDITANPLFVNPYGDFRVTCSSPVINKASDGSNMGAYQGCENVVRPRTLFVSTTGSDVTGDGSSGNPFQTVQKGVDEAFPFDTVKLLPGVYNENVVLQQKKNLIGSGVGETIIDGSGTGNVVKMARSTTVSGLTIRNGAIGVLSDGADSWTLANCDIKNNSADGVRLAPQSLDCHISGCSISNNNFGIFVMCGFNLANSAVVDDVDIFNNQRGVFSDCSQNITFTRCRVFKNIEAGFYNDNGGGQFIVDHCVIAENEGDGFYKIRGERAEDVIVQNSIIFENGNAGLNTWGSVGFISRYNDVCINKVLDYSSEVIDRTGDISANPLFVNPYSDFRVACGSPVIGAGSEGSNMGAYQGCENVVRPRTLFVSTSGSDVTGDGSSGNPFQTVQKGVDEAFPFDTVRVSPGVYNENVVLQQYKNLIGSGIGETIIDAGGTGNVVKMARSTTVSNLTIRNGAIGVMSDDADYWTLANCDIKNNSADGVRLAPESLGNHISACSISNNNFGINVVCGFRRLNSAVIDDVDIFDNQRGVFSDCSQNITFTRCRVFKNIEAGFYNDNGGGQFIVDHCVIAENEGDGFYKIRGGRAEDVIVQNSIIFENGNVGLNTWGSVGFISRYNDVFGNTGGDYSPEVIDRTGDINADPLFADITSNDFRLQCGSPAIGTASDGSNMGWYQGHCVGLNQLPVANAGSDQTVEATSANGAFVQLDGTGSFDLDEDELTYSWSADGITFDEPTSATPSAQFPIGTTTVTLIVNDGTDDSQPDQVEIMVESPLPRDYIVFATHSIWLKQNSEILSGSVGVDSAGTGPFLDSQLELSVGEDVTTPSGFGVKANRIKVKQGAVVKGDVYYNELTNNGTVEGTLNSPLSLPLFPTLPPFFSASPGIQDTVIAKSDSISLDAGDYGNITVKTKGIILFTGGIYNIRSIGTSDNVKLLFAAPSEIRVAEKFDTDQKSYIGPDGSSTIAASDIVFYIAGINGNNGNLGATPKAAQIGLNNTVFANFYVANGTLWLREHTNATGAFIAKDVIVGIGAKLSLDSFLDNGSLSRAESDSEMAKTRTGSLLKAGSDSSMLNVSKAEQPSADNRPETFSLEQNYPNPFNPQTEIRFQLPEASHVTLKIYNLLGEEIRTLVDAPYEPGYHHLQWDGKNAIGEPVASGVFLYRIEAGPFSQVKKMSLLR